MLIIISYHRLFRWKLCVSPSSCPHKYRGFYLPTMWLQRKSPLKPPLSTPHCKMQLRECKAYSKAVGVDITPNMTILANHKAGKINDWKDSNGVPQQDGFFFFLIWTDSKVELLLALTNEYKHNKYSNKALQHIGASISANTSIMATP